MSGKRTEPGIDGVDGFHHGCEVAALNDLLDQPQFLVGETRIGVPDRDRRGDIGHACHVGPQLLQGHVGVERFVCCIRVHEGGRLVGHDFLEDRRDGLALGEPLAAYLGEELRRVGLVEQDRARAPPIRERHAVEIVQQAGRRRGREAGDGEDTQMLTAKARLQPAG